MGGAIIIPVNQIKLVKKDNASPSPESRLPTKTQLSPKSFIFPQKSDPQNQIRKT